MKIKIVSLVGLLLATVVTSGSVFAQKIIGVAMTPKHFIRLNQENSKMLNLDLDVLKSMIGAKEDDRIFATIDDEGEIINLGIYNIQEFSVSRVDRDGAGH